MIALVEALLSELAIIGPEFMMLCGMHRVPMTRRPTRLFVRNPGSDRVITLDIKTDWR